MLELWLYVGFRISNLHGAASAGGGVWLDVMVGGPLV